MTDSRKALISKRENCWNITAPDIVEVEIRGDGKVLWINIDGSCQFRASQIGTLVITDNRDASLKEQPDG